MINMGYFPASVKNRQTPESIEIVLRDLINVDLGGIDPHFFRAEISSARTDAYHTHMAKSTLENFAGDAKRGISFLDSHDAHKLGFGQSLMGIYQDERVIADFYTVPGVKFGGQHSYQSTDDFIRALQAGLVRDVSVGFYDGDMICDLCGNSFYDYANCQHWPGQAYEVEEKSVVSTFAIENAHLAEVSAVYDGATPGAMILRANEMANRGMLDPEQIGKLETQLRIKINTGQRIWPVKENLTRGVKPMDENEKMLEKISEIVTVSGVRNEDLAEAVQTLADENTRLVTLADEGQEYRKDLIKQALAEGVRAMGETFPAETYEKMMMSADPSQIKILRDSWAKQASEIFTAGRKTVDAETAPEAAPAPTAGTVPASAYKS